MKNKFAFGLDVLNGRMRSKTPIKVAFVCTLRCNFRCSYCGLHKRKYYEMDTDEVLKMMDAYKEMGTVAWGFTGGEPLLRSDIGILVDRAKELGFLTTMVSNGSMIKDRIDIVKKLDTLIVSLDGFKTNDLTRGKGSFERTKEGIMFARSEGVDVVLQAVINKSNSLFGGEDLLRVVKFAEENGCKFVAQPLYSDDFKKNNEDGVEKGINLLYRIKRLYPKTVYYTHSEMRWMESYDSNDRKCYAGKYFLTILPNGKAVMCTMFFNMKDDLSKPVVDHKKEFNNLEEAKNGCACTLACSSKFNSLFSFKMDSLRMT